MATGLAIFGILLFLQPGMSGPFHCITVEQQILRIRKGQAIFRICPLDQLSKLELPPPGSVPAGLYTDAVLRLERIDGDLFELPILGFDLRELEQLATAVRRQAGCR